VKFLKNTLDAKGSGKLSFKEFVNGLSTRFSIYLSDPEKEALRAKFENKKEGCVLISEVQSCLKQQNWTMVAQKYKITKAEFIDFVLSEWEGFIQH